MTDEKLTSCYRSHFYDKIPFTLFVDIDLINHSYIFSAVMNTPFMVPDKEQIRSDRIRDMSSCQGNFQGIFLFPDHIYNHTGYIRISLKNLPLSHEVS